MVNPLDAPTSDDKLWGGLSYVGLACCMIPTIVIFFLKKDESRFIKFHALQALAVGIVMIVLNVISMVISAIIPILGGLVSILLMVVLTVVWIFLMIQAFTGKDYRVPQLADFIDQNLMG